MCWGKKSGWLATQTLPLPAFFLVLFFFVVAGCFAVGFFFFFWPPHHTSDQGSNPCPLQWKFRVLTPGPHGFLTLSAFHEQFSHFLHTDMCNFP